MDGSRFSGLSSISVLGRSLWCLSERPLVFPHTKNFYRENRVKRCPISKFLLTFALAIDCHTLPSAAQGDQRPKLNQTTHGSPWRGLSFPRVHLLTKTWKKKNFENWIIATRPWALPASVMPILIMWAYLYCQSHGGGEDTTPINWLNALLCLPLLSIVHSGGNMVSDYFDFTWGVDTKACSNGVTWIHDGTFRPKEILRYGLVLVALAVPIGVFLLYNSSWSGWWIGLAGVLLSLVYPWMKSHHLGDINILCSFALLPALGTFFVAVGVYDPQSLLMILPIGLITVAILHANNTRDVKTDLQAGLGTITTSVSLMNAKAIYTFEIFAPYALALLYVVLLGQPWTLLAVVLTLPLALRNVRTMIQAEDDLPYRGIQRLDQTTAQLQMAFGLLYALGFFLGSWLGV